jgi:hypothetical protein
MNHDHIHAVVARCLVDPKFLAENLEGTDDALADAGGDAAAVQGIALFQAFIVKVKHTGVRNALPSVFRLLSAVAEELAFFRYYAPSYLAVRSKGPLPLGDLIKLFAEHLTRYLDTRQDAASAAFRELLSHEMTLWRMRAEMPPRQQDKRAGALTWRGRMEVARYATDVPRLCAALKTKTFTPTDSFAARDVSLAYWRSRGGGPAQAFEIDELTSLLFSLVDGRRSLDLIGAALADMGLQDVSTADLKRFYGEMAKREFLEPLASPRRIARPRKRKTHHACHVRR